MAFDVDFFNPFRYVRPDEYINFWYWMINTLLQGFWSRVIAVIFFVLALWVSIRRHNFRQAMIFYLLSFLWAYGGGIIYFLKRVLGVMKFL